MALVFSPFAEEKSEREIKKRKRVKENLSKI
jgi:hypothetical protein